MLPRYAWSVLAPSDSAAWIALVAGLLALGSVWLPWNRRVSFRLVVGAIALCAGLLSLLYVVLYLRGGPRIIDATSYWLQARAMASGLVSWDLPEPTASFRGRFLLHRLVGDHTSMGVIFPPGYAALLAMGFLARVPLAVGPLLAIALAVLTALLARDLFDSQRAGVVAAILSALSATLRYHTAETMSHGWAAVLALFSVFMLVKSRTSPRKSAYWIASGFAWGWLFATRPATSLALLGLFAVWSLRELRAGAWRLPLYWSIGIVVPVVLLALHQHELTGLWGQTSQHAYYAVSDGPPGCFRYGFGSGIGCVVEHGPYVASVLPNGHGIVSAATTTGRRLYLHVGDVLNYAPFALALAPACWIAIRRRLVWLVVVPVLLVMVYTPFYFDGSYPGGGARLFSEALAFEHVLLAGLATVLPTSWNSGSVFAAIPLLGFAFHASHLHAHLRDRDGGAPLYSAELLEREIPQKNRRSLVFIDSDHGFNLAHDPRALRSDLGTVVARSRGGGYDTRLWNTLGRPDAYRYSAFGLDVHQVSPWEPPSDSRSFELESEWPPIAQEGAISAPSHFAPSCVSQGSALSVKPLQPQGCVTLPLPRPDTSEKFLVRFVLDASTTVSIVDAIDGTSLAVVRLTPPNDGFESCVDSPEIRAPRRTTMVKICTDAKWIALDQLRWP